MAPESRVPGRRALGRLVPLVMVMLFVLALITQDGARVRSGRMPPVTPPLGAFITPGRAGGDDSVTTFEPLVGAQEHLLTVVVPGTLTVTAGGSDLEVEGASAELHDVVVTDTRDGNPGWNVMGVLTWPRDVGTTGPTGLGWTPRLVSQLPVQRVTAGPLVPASVGLITPALLGSAPAGASLGTAVLTAVLALRTSDTTPVPLPPGRVVLTVTAI